MALPNIELYEVLKKDISDEGARMIAEVVPAAGDLATKGDIHLLKTDVQAFELRMERRISQMERRFFTLQLTLILPLWGALVAAAVKFVIQI